MSQSRSISTSHLLAVNANWVGLSFMWNALHPIVLPALVVNFVPAGSKNTYLGLLTFGGLLIAMVMQPAAGALSDQWTSRHGRRRPLIVLGTVFDCVFLAVLAWSGGFAWLLLGYVALQVSSNTAQGPLQGLMRDRVPPSQLGAASSIKMLLDLASLVAASFVAGHLMADGQAGTIVTILVIGAVLLISASITVLLAGEESSDRPAPSSVSPAREPLPRWMDPGYMWLIGQRGAFLLGVYGLQTFGQYYLQDMLQVPDPPTQAGYLLATVGAGTIVLVVVGGWLSDHVGPEPLLYAASTLTSAGMFLMAFTTTLGALYGVGAVVGAGIGLFLTSNWALANRLAPADQAGRFLGLTNLATAGAAALARLQGPAVDFLNGLQPDAWLGYKGVFVFGGICVAASSLLLRKVR